MPRKPTDSEIADAKRFVERRVKAQKEAVEDLSRSFDEAAERIAAIVLKYKARNMTLRFTGSGMMASEVEEVINWLEHEIETYLLMKCVPPEEENDSVVSKIQKKVTGEYMGATFDERERHYISKYLLALKVAGLSGIDMDEEAIIDSIGDATEQPRHRFEILVENTVALGWMAWELENAIGEGAAGFYVINGNNPCSFCAEMEGWHPITDDPPLYHPNCQCIVVYI